MGCCHETEESRMERTGEDYRCTVRWVWFVVWCALMELFGCEEEMKKKKWQTLIMENRVAVSDVFIQLHNAVLFWYCIASFLTTLCYTTLHYTTLHYTTIHYTTLHYTTLHYTDSYFPFWNTSLSSPLDEVYPSSHPHINSYIHLFFNPFFHLLFWSS